MKHICKLSPFNLWVVGGIALFFLLCFYLVRLDKEEVRAKAWDAFETTIERDFHKRAASIEYINRGRGEGKAVEASYQTETDKKTVYFKDGIALDLLFRLQGQHAMREINPIQPDNFNALFREELESKGISPSQTGIIYQYKGQRQYSDNDSTTQHTALLLPPDTIDIDKSISVQAWVKQESMCALRNVSGRTWSILTAYIVALLSGAYICQGRLKHRKEPTAPFLTNITQVSGMMLDEQNARVYIDGSPCPMSKYEFDLMLLFAQAPAHTLKAEHIQHTFWPHAMNARNNMHNLVFKLKAALKDFPDYRIESKAGVEYVFIYPTKEQNPQIL